MTTTGTTRLCDAVRGVLYKIKQFTPSSSEHMRLMELGFQSGAEVSLLHRAPFQGLIKVKIKETRFAICLSEASCIVVEPTVRCA